MAILKFLAINWDSVVVVLTIIIAIVFLVIKKQWGPLDKMLFALITWAEREYGRDTGILKLAAVVERIYPHIPAIIRIFIPSAMLEKMIENALADAKKRWEQNPALLSK